MMWVSIPLSFEITGIYHFCSCLRLGLNPEFIIPNHSQLCPQDDHLELHWILNSRVYSLRKLLI